ncbi:MAG: energy-coupling factor transporter transmembrane protein EcfT [Eubacterium sp.]|jgi:energy-coupling factor transport system permease protein|nr:energy-coupling factor transporter transmembrane protein EcfT [Eubacterium sp.]
MANITIGQYYPENSIIHKLDPRVKLFGTMVLIVLLFMIKNVWGYALFTVFMAAIIKASKVPFAKLLRGVRGILFILLFSAVLNVFLTPGHVLVEFWMITITKEGIIKGGVIAVRLIYLVICTSIMTLTTTPNNLADGLEKAFGFLKVIKFPVHEISMIMSLALRFIPTLMEETDKITKAQKARGAQFDTGNIIQKAKSLIPILIPLFISSIRRALDLATAMEARCYHSGKRTKMKPLKYVKRDYFAYGSCFVMIAVVLGANYL